MLAFRNVWVGTVAVFVCEVTSLHIFTWSCCLDGVAEGGGVDEGGVEDSSDAVSTLRFREASGGVTSGGVTPGTSGAGGNGAAAFHGLSHDSFHGSGVVAGGSTAVAPSTGKDCTEARSVSADGNNDGQSEHSDGTSSAEDWEAVAVAMGEDVQGLHFLAVLAAKVPPVAVDLFCQRRWYVEACFRMRQRIVVGFPHPLPALHRL
jgi:hypothetical protein